MSTYTRPHLTFEQQIELLKSRGLNVHDEAAALSYLRQLGYYRLSAYWYPFRKRKLIQVDQAIAFQIEDDFEQGACFQDAVELYLFDKKLRLLVMDALERIEVALRVDLAYYMGGIDTFAHQRPDLLDGNFTRKRDGIAPSDHEIWLGKLTTLMDRSKEEFVRHYKAKYGLPLPLWVSIEIWDFGLLSRFYSGIKFVDQQAVAVRFGVNKPHLMASWMRMFNYVRNIVAHHSRLWNRNMIDQPKIPRQGEVPRFDAVLSGFDVSRPYAALCILAFLMDQVSPASGWSGRLAAHLEGFPALAVSKVSIAGMGCPPGWRGQAFWPQR